MRPQRARRRLGGARVLSTVSLTTDATFFAAQEFFLQAQVRVFAAIDSSRQHHRQYGPARAAMAVYGDHRLLVAWLRARERCRNATLCGRNALLCGRNASLCDHPFRRAAFAASLSRQAARVQQ